MRFKFCVVVTLSLWLCSLASGRAIWIDTDPAIGSPFREVDDAFALVLAFHSPELRIAGISTTYGNASLRTTTRVARDLVRRFGAAEVFPGARASRDLGRITPASEALAAALRQDQHVTYVALGPLTNLATFLKLHPSLADRIDEIIFVGGQSPNATLGFGRNQWLRIHDANVVKDPEAVRTVLRSNIPLVLAPIETSAQLSLDAADLRSVDDYLEQRSRTWLWFWTRFVKTKGAPIFDALAICMLPPELVETQDRHAIVDATGNLIADPRNRSGTRPVRFGTSLKPTTKQFVRRRLARQR
ncbi:MAG: nucleoside hydrolase [Spartobacteria bacterium]